MAAEGAGIKRKFAVFGFSLLISDIVLLLAELRFIYIMFAVLLAVSIVAVLLRRPFCSYLFTYTLAFTVAAISLNIAFFLFYTPSLAFTGSNIQISGQLKDFPVVYESGYLRAVLKDCVINGVQTPYSVVLIEKAPLAAEPFDRLGFTASELFNSSEKGAFYWHTLSGGEWLTAFQSGEILIEKTGDSGILKNILLLRRNITQSLALNMRADTAGVAAALVTGDKSYIDSQTLSAFRLGGVSHIFAVSGMHLSVWSNILFIIMQRRSRTKRLPLAAASAFVVFYCVFTGASPSVLRSGIMLLCVYAGAAIRRKSDPVNSLGLSAAILLTVNPFLAGNVSFLLSFASTFALTVVFGTLFPAEVSSRSIPGRSVSGVVQNILLSFCVLFTTLPLTSFFFGYCTLLSPLSSLLCSPAAAGLMISASAAVLCGKIGFLSRALYLISDFLASFIIKICRFVSGLDFALCPLNEFYTLPWFAFTAGGVLFLYFVKKKPARCIRRFCGLSAVFILIFSALYSHFTRDDIRLYIPDAGNATSLCLTGSSGGLSLLYGCGGEYETASDINRFFISNAGGLDYMLLPSENESDTALCKQLLRSLPPQTLIQPEGLGFHAENSLSQNSFSGELCRGIEIESLTADGFHAALFTLNKKRIVVCASPSSDFSGMDSRWRSGDLLICRAAIPKTLSYNDFGQIIVLSSKSGKALKLPANAVSTADTGDVSITITLDGIRRPVFGN